jgi:amino acid adenylation domain-containing protein
LQSQGRTNLESAGNILVALPDGLRQDGPVRNDQDVEAAPLSLAQRRLWYLHRMSADPGVLNLGCSLLLSRQPDQAALEGAFQLIVARHSVLRTAFKIESPDGSLAQEALFRLEHISLEDEVGEGVRLRMAERIFETNLQRPFVLDQPPLMRAGLIRLAEEESLLWLTFHPLVIDPFSVRILLQEITTVYDALVRGHSPSLPDPLFAYSDFASWQHTRLAEHAWTPDVEAWREVLPATLPILDIPADHPRPSVKTYAGRRVHGRLPAERVELLRALAASEQCSLSMILFGAWGIFLHRMTEHSAIVVGHDAPNRDAGGAGDVIGRFENILPVMLSFHQKTPLAAYFQDVRQRVSEAAQRQHVPFEHLVEEIDPTRDLSRSPLFQARFAYEEPAANPEKKLCGAAVHPASLLSAGSPTDLSLSCRERQERLDLTLTYSTDLFTEETAQRFLTRFDALLGFLSDCFLSSQPNVSIGDVSLLTNTEEQQLAHWNDTRTEFSPALTHQIFERSAEIFPERIAIECGESLTYAELNRIANKTAWLLMNHGVGPGSLVGVYMHRTAEVVSSLLGILKAGAAYVPLDPAYPRDRLTYVVENSNIQILLCSQDLVNSAPGTGLTCLVMDDPQASWRKGSENNPICRAGSEDVVYVLYTSGSTGKPKGVEIPHRAVSNFLNTMQREMGLTPEDRVLALTTLSFDISVLEIFLTLLAGARIVMIDRQTLLDPKALIRRTEDSSVTLMQATPATWRMLVDAGWQGGAGLRAITGGEALNPDLAAQLLDRCDVLWDMYGPTEATVYATVWKVRRGERIVIGRPVANTTAYVLDARFRQSPIGVYGELYLAGVQLARGYLGRPDLTDERFLPNPFMPGTKMYRTGDSARFLSDGSIEYLGRLDHQVKIRGYRIELGEIESVLVEQPGVAKAIVVAREDQGIKRLIGYFTAGAGCQLDPEDLKSGLRQKLPDYMIPAHLIGLERFPMTPNGKIDRLTLPMPDPGRDRTAEVVPGRDPMEQALIEIWEQELGVKPVGIHDDFFRLGGDSLLAVRVLVRAEAFFGKKLLLATLFQAPTIAQLAATLRDSPAEAFSCVVPIQTKGTKSPLFLVHGLGGNVMGFHTLAPHLRPIVPLYGIQASGLDGTAPPLDNIEAMAARYVGELRQVQPYGPYHLGGLSGGGIIALEMAHLLKEQGEEIGCLIMLDAYAYGVEKLSNASDRTRRGLAWAARRACIHAGALAALSFSEKLDYVRRKCHTLKRRIVWKLRAGQYKNFLPDVEQLPARYKAVALAAWTAMHNYTPRPFQGHVLVLRAKGEPFLRNNDPSLGWREVVRPEPSVRAVPGDHLTILHEPNATTVAAIILSYLTEPKISAENP